jgi:hypothetical protein
MRRRTMLAAIAAMAWTAAVAQEPQLAEAIGRLAQERSQAEEAAALLKKFEPGDVDGRALYAQAKAAFDGLIEQLLADLAQGRDPKASPAFQASLDTAAAKRAAFGAHVDAVAKAHVPAGGKPGWVASLGQVPATVAMAMTESGVNIWREWGKAGAERRRDIAARIAAQRWKPWTDIPAAL